jgi:DNA (cytosine-5)-methyltransferase 1
MIGIDVFSGAGGMSFGAASCGIDIRFAIENNASAVATFRRNHPRTTVIANDVRSVKLDRRAVRPRGEQVILFGGPPCQGFSTSNQKTRGVDNENNWLFQEYLRFVRTLSPDWIVFENVKGLIETENGFFLEKVLKGFKKFGYATSAFVLNSADFGVPQKRNRLFIVGSLHGVELAAPRRTCKNYVTVAEAIDDLPDLENGDAPDECTYRKSNYSVYASTMRKRRLTCMNNIVTRNATHIVERYSYIPQGGNWQNIPKRLMGSYADVSRCHTGIYRRLSADEPSVVIGNFRKNMLIHPWKDRGLSVREAARLQSFPDNFVFEGSIGLQQQQVGNAVPPLLAKAVFLQIKKSS